MDPSVANSIDNMVTFFDNSVKELNYLQEEMKKTLKTSKSIGMGGTHLLKITPSPTASKNNLVVCATLVGLASCTVTGAVITGTAAAYLLENSRRFRVILDDFVEKFNTDVMNRNKLIKYLSELSKGLNEKTQQSQEICFKKIWIAFLNNKGVVNNPDFIKVTKQELVDCLGHRIVFVPFLKRPSNKDETKPGVLSSLQKGVSDVVLSAQRLTDEIMSWDEQNYPELRHVNQMIFEFTKRSNDLSMFMFGRSNDNNNNDSQDDIEFRNYAKKEVEEAYRNMKS